MEVFEETDVTPEQAWMATFVAGVVAVAGAALVFTERVYHGFLWRFFWGPVHADADGVDCYVRYTDGRLVPGTDAPYGCAGGAYESAVVAEPGYTVISTLCYILVLLFMLAGVYLLLERFDLDPYDEFFYALVPFMLFGGALRTVEDAFVAAKRAGAAPALEFPASAVLISPFIYGTVFLIALGSFLLSKYLAAKDITETWTRPLGVLGTLSLAGAFGYLVVLSAMTSYVAFFPSVLVVILGLAIVGAAVAYVAGDRYDESIHGGTGLMGLIVLWGHGVDGFANVIANDWTHVWDTGLQYSAKHPFNQFVMDTTNAIQGGQSIAGIYVGDAWPFAIIKLLVPLVIVAIFDEEFFEDSPRFAIMLLGAILAVGLGPGTRDMLRFAFGI
jgi:uncharacterized membrane protein